MKKRTFTFADYVYFTAKWRKTIVTTVLIVCILTAALSLVLPRWYTSGTTILPPVEDTGDLGISSWLSQIPFSGAGLGLGIVSEETSLFMAILNSRSVMEKVIHEFGLEKRYRSKNMEEAVRTLRERFSTRVNEEGTITLQVRARTPWLGRGESVVEARTLARDMANFFIEELDRTNKTLKVSRARNTRIFIEERYRQNLIDLSAAEEALKRFQQEHGTIAITEQTAATISAAAELKAQAIAKEIEIGLLEKSVGPEHSQTLMARQELAELNRQYRRFQDGVGGRTQGTDVFIPLDDVPELGLEYARLFRDVVLQEKILEFIMPQYEQARITEARDTPTVQVLDPAAIPVAKSRPKRALLVVIAGFCSLLFLFAGILIREHLQMLRESEPDEYDKYQFASKALRGDLKWRKRRK